MEFEETATKEEIETYQINKIKEIVAYVKKNVPFYKEKYECFDTEISSLNDFKKLPVLSKSELRNNPEKFISKLYDRSKLITISTGGSTGEPLSLFYEKGVVRTREFVFLNHQWSRVGYKFGDKIAVFRSAMIRGREKNQLWDYDPIKNRFIYSTFDLNPENITKILEHMRKVKPKYLYVYPSALTVIANYMKSNNEIPIPSIKGIWTASENAYPSQIKLFNEVFQAPVCRQYGLGELAAFAGSCEHSLSYHCYNTYSYVELLDSDGNEINVPGKVGEIVGTSFDIYSMPLIRYRTGDFAVFENTSCSSCGYKGLIFSEIEGRAQEKIVDKFGNIFSLGPFIFGIHEEFWSKISSIQFIQEKIGILEILVSSNTMNSEEVKSYVHNLFQPRFSNNFEILVKSVNQIDKTFSGKHKYLIQRLSL